MEIKKVNIISKLGTKIHYTHSIDKDGKLDLVLHLPNSFRELDHDGSLVIDLKPNEFEAEKNIPNDTRADADEDNFIEAHDESETEKE